MYLYVDKSKKPTHDSIKTYKQYLKGFFDIQVSLFAVFFSSNTNDGCPTRAKGLTLLSAPKASSSCCGERPHSKFLMAQTESVTAALLVTDCRSKKEGKNN